MKFSLNERPLNRFAINIVGFVDANYDRDQVFQMLNRLSMMEQFKPVNVVEIVVQEMEQKDTVDKNKVTRKKLSEY